MTSNHLIFCCLLLLLHTIFSSNQGFSSEAALCIKWPKYWSFNFSISPSNEYSGLISFKVDWFDLLAVRDSQESSPVPQFKSINSLVLQFLYGPTLTSVYDYWKNHRLTIWTSVSKAMSLLFNMMSRLVSFSSKEQAPFNFTVSSQLSEMILEHKKIKSVTVFIFSQPICHEMIGPDAMIFVF